MHTFLKKIALFLMANLVFLFIFRFSSAELWEKVAEKGFHDPSNDYAWSMETFQDHIYVGTLNPIKRTVGVDFTSPCFECGHRGLVGKLEINTNYADSHHFRAPTIYV